MTREQLDALHAAATPGEWEYRQDTEFSDKESFDNVVECDGEVLIWEADCSDHHIDIDRANYACMVALHNAWPTISAKLALLEWIIDEMNKIPELQTGHADEVAVLYDNCIAPWMDGIAKRYRELEKQP